MINFIQGGASTDVRGDIKYVNDFDMSDVKRFYIIRNADEGVVRGWRAHRSEQRWFYVLSGTFVLDVVKIDDWQEASVDLPVERIILSAEGNRILHVPKGYGTSIRMVKAPAELLVFADSLIEKAQDDDYTWPIDYFIKRLS